MAAGGVRCYLASSVLVMIALALGDRTEPHAVIGFPAEVLTGIGLGGPQGPLPDKEAPLAEGGAGGKKKKKKGKKQPVPPGLEDGQRYATGCLRVMALKKELREEMMGAGILRYTAALMMSKNHKARWHARNIILALASDEENR